ncbi:54S ribosomal protein L25, mitochondrial [Exophiala xenobiotica]|uniref:54S ribosomal protein L25, mitochondrial n=1 Tax=Vermiconidia calcicola TaxID=1690605 RepID=A0AAV9Q6H1_9PEZI|nr:54S ribosomal protein L25, mitochondrial [Exophiala xenobiotica]KAK5536830.1 54S ribosomal protein L25, mitochondrial [Vermiconidia calcicola]KAK5542979.1 54S ribosomal protein L25, mitochondrial [Chaetothyriales sp. CCFEE 6169]KAK5263993.1 54S ribosomal protein L25, mitochondrial [Exophiala xenobiotica]KAK5277336.1 54S ribosomal protein L25, mitochondrial [Exophiala xenobiotica]
MAEAVRAFNSSTLGLPKRLLDFFARYPPELYSAKFTGVTLPLTRKESKEAAIARNVASSAASAQTSQTMTAVAATSEELTPTTPTLASSSAEQKLPSNPFLPRKNFVTGKWAGAKIGLRRQAELVKLAKEYDIEELLPPSRKSTVFKQARLLEQGLRVKGTGEGQKVKGHAWERHVGATLEKRRTAMENMPELVKEWKRRGHGRGWKKYPK